MQNSGIVPFHSQTQIPTAVVVENVMSYQDFSNVLSMREIAEAMTSFQKASLSDEEKKQVFQNATLLTKKQDCNVGPSHVWVCDSHCSLPQPGYLPEHHEGVRDAIERALGEVLEFRNY